MNAPNSAREALEAQLDCQHATVDYLKMIHGWVRFFGIMVLINMTVVFAFVLYLTSHASTHLVVAP